MSVRLPVLFIFCVAAPPLLWPGSADAQDRPGYNPVAAIASWVAMDAPTGHEHLATEALAIQFVGWETDRNGNLLKTVGSGSPRRVVACGLDSDAFAVSQITSEGYLRLHRIGGGPASDLWDQSHEAQQVRVLSIEGPIVGVIGISNGHFAQQHRGDVAVVTADHLWLDVGAESAAEVLEMGIQLLDPVVRHLPAWYFAQSVAGPGAGARAGCAAVMSAASTGSVGTGQTTYVLSTQRVFGWLGLGGVVNRMESVDEVIMVGPGESSRLDEVVDPSDLRRLSSVFSRSGVRSVRRIAPQVTNPGALMEELTLMEADALLDAVLAASASRVPDEGRWLFVSPPREAINEAPGRTATSDRLTSVHGLLDGLAETPAVPEHEGPIRNIVLKNMPDWARDRAVVDDIGNVWVVVGPSRDTVVIMAHMDEVGWAVESVAEDGTVSLRRRGGAIPSAWEGQPARLQLDAGSGAESGPEVRELNGVFSTRLEATEKSPRTVTAWFGMDRRALEAEGVRPGMGVTGYKEGHRMGQYRYTARSLDDRAGTTALLLALQRIDPQALDHTVIFSWSVQEEGGLVGAGVMADRFAAAARQIYSVDTFVSSDTPLESPHFAYAPLGEGPVLRSIENSGMATRAQKDRNLAIAAAAGVEVQVGLTQGGTDGTKFSFWGAPNAGLSWPGRYSHSPAEVLDLRDLADLVDLVVAMVMADPLG